VTEAPAATPEPPPPDAPEAGQPPPDGPTDDPKPDEGAGEQMPWSLRRVLRTADAELWAVLAGTTRFGTVSLQYAPGVVEGVVALPADLSGDAAKGMIIWITELLDLDSAAGPGGVIHWVVSTGVVEDLYRRSPGRRATGLETDVATARARIEPVLAGMFPEMATLPDGGYAVDTGSVRVFVNVRLADGGAVLVRVFSITNLDVEVDGELPAFLLSLNFSMALGRFSLDTEHRAVWCDHVLTADELDDATLGRTIAAVAATADRYDDEIKTRFGGRTFREEGSPVDQAATLAAQGMAGGYL
jgi:hypothetical protein